jgi:hypothetical protein
MRVSVIGGSSVSEAAAATAERLGRTLAERGHTVVCGGKGGVMEAACRGAVEAGGDTVGILPSGDPDEANEFVETVVCTGLGHARNALVVLNGDAVIGVDGSGGTLSEIGFAAVYDRPIAGLGTIEAPHVEICETPDDAVAYVEAEAEAVY